MTSKRDHAHLDDSTHAAGTEYFGNLSQAPPPSTAVIRGNTFSTKGIQYIAVDGMAVIEGDIVLGTVAAVDAATDALRQQALINGAGGVAVEGFEFRWPDRQIPYAIDSDLTDKDRVKKAIEHWESQTKIRFIQRDGHHPNWVQFVESVGCWSEVGMRGGRQSIGLGVNCGVGSVIHEIGHTVGLWHEQSREDRDLYIRILWQNVQAGMELQFAQHISDGYDLGSYDYESIMHYPRTAFSRNAKDTISTVDPAATIGQRTGLSAGDISAVEKLYSVI